MQLAVAPPVLPMLAKRVSALPTGDAWIFEPKWDGFRTLIFRDGEELLIQSRDQKSLNRYFPELIAPLVARDEGLDFDALQLRVHPAASRVQLLSRELPASVVFFDLLCEGAKGLLTEAFRARRTRLEAVLRNAKPPLFITPSTTDRARAADWFARFEGAGLDGVMAKAEDGGYEPNKRVMFKVKHDRECDCVVAGFRWHKTGNKDSIGSLLLGLYNEQGALQHVGVCASFTMAKRRELAEFLAPYRTDALADHPWRSWADNDSGDAGEQRMPGGKSRWSQGKDLSWEPLRAELVVEVAYDHMQGGRFRHTAQFRRFRSDKPASACTYEQLEVVVAQELSEIFRK
jgi:ATP-dependent DNA ligase